MRVWLLLAFAGVGCSGATAAILESGVGPEAGTLDAGREASFDSGAFDAARDSEPSVDAADAGDAADANTCPLLTDRDTGTTMAFEPVGTGQPTFCSADCGAPAYGYVMIDGGSPAVIGCSQLNGGSRFCCTGAMCGRNAATDTFCADGGFGRVFNWDCFEDPLGPNYPIGRGGPNCQGRTTVADGGIVSMCCANAM